MLNFSRPKLISQYRVNRVTQELLFSLEVLCEGRDLDDSIY